MDHLYSTALRAVITMLKGHFARCGKPDEIVSDNRLQFAAQEFPVFVQEYKLKQVYQPTLPLV